MKKTKTNRRTYSAARCPLPAPSRTGFSLVELIIVIAIIIILGGIGIGVGYKFLKAADIETTKANMTLFMNALEGYFDEYGSYPTYDPAYSIDGIDYSLIRMNRTDSAGVEIPRYSFFIDNLKKIDTNSMTIIIAPTSGNPTEAIFVLHTPSKQIIQYYPDKAMGGTPLLIAPGDDGLYGTDATNKKERDAWGADDIRSDK